MSGGYLAEVCSPPSPSAVLEAGISGVGADVVDSRLLKTSTVPPDCCIITYLFVALDRLLM